MSLKAKLTALFCALLASAAYAQVKLSQINNGGAINTSTDQCVAVRSGTTDELVTLAASAGTDTTNASNISSGTLNCAQTPALTGDVTTSSCAATLATVNANVGTFQGITVNGKGLVTGASNQSYLTGNQNITLSGGASGSGTTAISVTLANPSASTLGGVNSFASATNNFLTGLSTAGAFSSARPICGTLSDATAFCSATGTQATAALNTFTSALQGVVPNSGGGTANFLRADGTFAAPGGTLTTTGTPASGNLTKFSGTTSITNGDLSGDVTTSGTLAATVAKINGATLGTTTATSGNILIGSGTQWVTKPIIGDVIFNSTGASLVSAINGAALGTTTATSGNILIGQGTTWATKAAIGDVLFKSTGATLISAINGTVFGSSVYVNTGASGANLPYLNGTNTWSEPQTFNSSGSAAVIFISAGGAEENTFANGNSGTSFALNIDKGPLQSLTISGAVAITLTTPTNPGKTIVVLTQDGSGHVYSISGCKWAGGVAITYSTAASKVDVISIMYDGSNFYCMGGAAFS